MAIIEYTEYPNGLETKKILNTDHIVLGRLENGIYYLKLIGDAYAEIHKSEYDQLMKKPNPNKNALADAWEDGAQSALGLVGFEGWYDRLQNPYEKGNVVA